MQYKLSPFLKNSLIVGLSNVLVIALGYAFHILAGRFLGPERYSEIVTVIAYSLILVVPVTAASVVMIKYIGRQTTKTAKSAAIFGFEKLLEKAIGNPKVLYGSAFILVMISRANGLSPLVALLVPAFVLSYIAAQYYAILLQGGKLFLPLAITFVLGAILKFTGPLLPAPYGGTGAIMMLLIVSNCVQIWTSRKYLRANLAFTGAHTQFAISPMSLLKRPHIRLIIAATLGITLLNNLDIVLAKALLSSGDAGIYGVWSLFAKAISYSFIPLASVALVYLTDHQKQVNERFVMTASFVILGVGGVVAGCMYYLLGPFMITTLMGAEFAPVIPLLSSAAIFGTVYSIMYLCNNYYLAHNSRFAIVALIAIPALALSLVLTGSSLTRFTTTLTWGSVLSLVPMIVGLSVVGSGRLRTKT